MKFGLALGGVGQASFARLTHPDTLETSEDHDSLFDIEVSHPSDGRGPMWRRVREAR